MFLKVLILVRLLPTHIITIIYMMVTFIITIFIFIILISGLCVWLRFVSGVCLVVWCGVSGGVVCVVQMIHNTASLSWRVRMMQLIRLAEHLGASSRRPRNSFPALMLGVSPAVYLCTRPKKPTHQPTNSICGAAQQGDRPPV